MLEIAMVMGFCLVGSSGRWYAAICGMPVQPLGRGGGAVAPRRRVALPDGRRRVLPLHLRAERTPQDGQVSSQQGGAA